MTGEILCHFTPHFTPHISPAKPDYDDDSLTGDLSSDCRFAGQTGLVPARETLHCEPLRAIEPPSHLQHTQHVGGGRRQEGGTTGTEEKAAVSSLHSNHQTLLSEVLSGLAKLGLDRC